MKLADVLELAKNAPAFPLRAGSKSDQLLRSWKREASQDSATIRQWFEKYPGCNWAIVTGRKCGGGFLCVVDLDGPQGAASLAVLEAQHGKLPSCPTVRTPHGQHRYFISREPLRNSAGKIAAGVDVRGLNGYVLAPGSTVDGKSYVPEHGDDIPALPQWLAELAGKRREAPKPSTEATTAPSASTRAQRHLASLPVSAEGSRNEDAFKAAAALKDFGLAEPDCLAAMVEHWQAHPALPIDELTRTVASAYNRPGMGSDAPENEFERVPGKPGSKPAGRGEYIALQPLDEVEPKPINWLWPGRIARGKLTLIAGDPSRGKSMLTAFLAAVTTHGGKWPVDGTQAPQGDVLFLSAEDDAADTIRPRMEAAGADLARVHVLGTVHREVNGELQERSVNLKADVRRLEACIATMGNVALVVIDPISAYLGDTDSHNNSDIRGVLAPLATMAARHDVAVVVVSHLNKGGRGIKTRAMSRVTGSGAFVAAARSAWLVEADEHSPDRRLFLPMKNNLAPDQSGLAFGFETVVIQSKGGPIKSARIVWESQPVTDVTADQALDREPSQESSAVGNAVLFLQSELSDGPVGAAQVWRDAQAAGVSRASLRRAQARLGIRPVKSSGSGGWVWALPAAASNDSPKVGCAVDIFA